MDRNQPHDQYFISKRSIGVMLIILEGLGILSIDRRLFTNPKIKSWQQAI